MNEKSTIFNEIVNDVIDALDAAEQNGVSVSPFDEVERIAEDRSIFDSRDVPEDDPKGKAPSDDEALGNNADEDENSKDDLTAKDMKDEKNDQKNNEQKYGKFKNPEELLRAYTELEKEFTRRSQKLKELENVKDTPFFSEDEWHEAVDKFFNETPSAKPFAKDIANEILRHPELKKDRNCLSVALTRILVDKFRTPEQLMSDGQFLKDYVLCSKEVKDAVISEYLQGIRAGEVPFVLSSGGMQCVTNPRSPKTIEEAGFMFLKDNE